MSEISETKLSEWEALAAAATCGPWEVRRNAGDHWGMREVFGPLLRILGFTVATDVTLEMACQIESDCDFIAESRTAVPELIQEVRRLRTALGLKDDETLISGKNGEFIAQDKIGHRQRVNMLQPEMRELEKLRASSPSWQDRPTGPGLWVRSGDRPKAFLWREIDQKQIGTQGWLMGRVFGPIPADEVQPTEGTETK